MSETTATPTDEELEALYSGESPGEKYLELVEKYGRRELADAVVLWHRKKQIAELDAACAETDRVKPRSTEEPLPAGRYWVGDPCYAFNREAPVPGGRQEWHAWLDETWNRYDPLGHNTRLLFDGEIAGARIVAASTMYGDGCYSDQEGRSYDVDAGLLGVVPEDAAVLNGEDVSRLMHLVDFPEPFHVSFSDDHGTIKIGHLRIRTGD